MTVEVPAAVRSQTFAVSFLAAICRPANDWDYWGIFLADVFASLEDKLSEIPDHISLMLAI
jgi:hypothetical protein